MNLSMVGPSPLSKMGSDSKITEILDFGFPQNSEIDTLKMYIHTEGVKSEQAVVRVISYIDGPLILTLYPHKARRVDSNHDTSNRSDELEAKRHQIQEE